MKSALISRLRRAWKILTTPSAVEIDHARREYTARVITLMSAIALLIFTVPILLGVVLWDFDVYSVVIMLVLDAASIAGLWLVINGHRKIGSAIPPIAFFFLGSFFSATNGLLSSAILFYPMAVLLTGMLLGEIPAWLMTTLSIMVHLIIGWLFDPLASDYLLSTGITLSGFLVGFTLLQTFFARQYRLALEQIRTHVKKLDLKTKELSILLESAKEFSSTLEFEKVLNLIAQNITQAIPADGCMIAGWDRKTDSISVWIDTVSGQSDHHPLIESAHPLNELPIMKLVLEEQQPICIQRSRPGTNPIIASRMEKLGIKSMLILPLAIGDKVFGLIRLHNSSTEKFFNNSEIQLTRALADQAAVAIEHTRLYRHVQKSLAEKEVLLREIHHRVKNNLQIITSLFSLQARKYGDSQLQNLLRESHNRIRAMALVHEKLYRSENLDCIDLEDYIVGLCDQILKSYSDIASGINLQVQSDKKLFLNIDTSITLGLVINEIVTNAIQHAFQHQPHGKILITLSQLGKPGYFLSIKDNGCGMPHNIDKQNPETLGLLLVTSLVTQLGGKIDIKIDNGTEFRIIFGENNASSSNFNR